MQFLFNIVLLLPLLSFLTLCFFSRTLGVYGSMIIACSNMLGSLVCGIVLFLNKSFTTIYFLEMWRWLSIVGLEIPFSLRYDGLTAVMFLVVGVVSTCVHFYSCVYMYTDPFLSRFLSYLSLFTFFMLLLVSSGNFLVLFMGWEGVGLCSYLLIGF